MREQMIQETHKPQLNIPVVGSQVFSPSEIIEKDKKTPYCTDCGNDKLAYIDQYANGEYWKCKECGKEFIW